MIKTAYDTPSSGSADQPPQASQPPSQLRAGPGVQTAYLVAPNPRYGVSGNWWTAVVLQQACQAIIRSTGI